MSETAFEEEERMNTREGAEKFWANPLV
jgi:hypothetical protein